MTDQPAQSIGLGQRIVGGGLCCARCRLGAGGGGTDRGYLDVGRIELLAGHGLGAARVERAIGDVDDFPLERVVAHRDLVPCGGLGAIAQRHAVGVGRYGAVAQRHGALRAGAGQIAQRGGERAGCRCFTTNSRRLVRAGGSFVAHCGCVGARCVSIVAQRHCAIANGARTQAGGDRAIATAAECANSDCASGGGAFLALVIHTGTCVCTHRHTIAVVRLCRRSQCGAGRASTAFSHRRLTQSDSCSADTAYGSIRRCFRGIGGAGGSAHTLVGGVQLLAGDGLGAGGAQCCVGYAADLSIGVRPVAHVQDGAGILSANAYLPAGRCLRDQLAVVQCALRRLLHAQELAPIHGVHAVLTDIAVSDINDPAWRSGIAYGDHIALRSYCTAPQCHRAGALCLRLIAKRHTVVLRTSKTTERDGARPTRCTSVRIIADGDPGNTATVVHCSGRIAHGNSELAGCMRIGPDRHRAKSVGYRSRTKYGASPLPGASIESEHGIVVTYRTRPVPEQRGVPALHMASSTQHHV